MAGVEFQGGDLAGDRGQQLGGGFGVLPPHCRQVGGPAFGETFSARRHRRLASRIGSDFEGQGLDPTILQGDVEVGSESLCPAGAVLAGNSIGGNVAARLAITRPDLVKGLMIIDSSGFEPPLTLPVRVFCTLMSHPRFVRAIYPLFSKAYMRARTDADHRARASAIALTRTPSGARALSAMWNSFKLPEHNLRSRAADITAPTVLVWGRHDPIVAPKCGEAAHRLIAGSKLIMIDSGHAPQTTNPPAVAAELLSLLGAAFGAA